MGLLDGILGTSSFNRAANESDHTPYTQASGDDAIGAIANITASIDVAGDRLDNLMRSALSIAAVNPKTKEGRQMARIHMAEAMVACSVTEDDAVNLTNGLESDDENLDVGNEAWSSIKDFVKSIIDYIKTQYAKLKKFVLKYWHKYFGDVESLKKAWIKVQEEAKTKQTGYTLEKNSKHDFERSADQFYTGALLKGEDLAAAAEAYADLVKAYPDVIDELGDVEFDEGELLNSDGLLADDFNKAPSTSLLTVLPGVKNNFTFNPTNDNSGLKYATKVSDVLAGRVVVGICQLTNASADKWADFFKYNRYYIGAKEKAQKKEKKANMVMVSAGTVEDIADKNIELLEETIALKRSKEITKLEAELDKATKALDKWKTNVPDDKDDKATEKRAAYRMAVNIAVESFSCIRRAAVSFPMELCQQARVVSSAHLEFAQRSLKAHKKD